MARNPIWLSSGLWMPDSCGTQPRNASGATIRDASSSLKASIESLGRMLPHPIPFPLQNVPHSMLRHTKSVPRPQLKSKSSSCQNQSSSESPQPSSSLPVGFSSGPPQDSSTGPSIPLLRLLRTCAGFLTVFRAAPRARAVSRKLPVLRYTLNQLASQGHRIHPQKSCVCHLHFCPSRPEGHFLSRCNTAPATR